MTITRKKIRLQRPQLQWNLPNAMRTIDNTQHAQLATNLNNPLERKPHGRHTNNRLKKRSPNPQPLTLRLHHHLPKPSNHLLNPHRKPNRNFPPLHTRLLTQRDEHALYRPVHGIKVHDDIPFPQTKVMQHGVHTRCRVLDQHDFVRWYVEQVCHGPARGCQG